MGSAFVENDEAVGQGTAAHVSKGAISITWRRSTWDVLETEHFIKRVVQRRRKGRSLRQVAGRKRASRRLGRRAHRRIRRICSRSSASTRRPRPVVLAVPAGPMPKLMSAQHFLDVALMVQPARANHALARANATALRWKRVGQFLDGRFLQVQIHRVRGQLADGASRYSRGSGARRLGWLRVRQSARIDYRGCGFRCPGVVRSSEVLSNCPQRLAKRRASKARGGNDGFDRCVHGPFGRPTAIR